MSSALFIVLPIFALILVGWLARRLEILGPHATTELNRFVVYLAFPALLFDVMAHARLSEIWRPGFITAFCVSASLVFGATIAIRLRAKQHLADATIDGLNAGYANTGFVGFPLMLATLGPEASAPTTITMMFNGCVLFSLAVVLVEVGLQTERSGRRIAATLVRSLVRNPLLVAPSLGLLVAIAGVPVPAPAESFLKLLGGTTSCCALVALGLFLGTRRQAAPRDPGVRPLLLVLKLVIQPALAWLLATPVLGLSPLIAHAVVLLSATPTGTGSFMLAELYQREAAVTSDVVLLSTIASVVTLSVLLSLFG